MQVFVRNTKIRSASFVFLAMLMIFSCGIVDGSKRKIDNSKTIVDQSNPKPKEFSFEVQSETFNVIMQSGSVQLTASTAQKSRRVENLQKSETAISWLYPDEKLAVNIQKKNDYLDVRLTYQQNDFTQIAFPHVKATFYYLPLNEGLAFSADDPVFVKYLKNQNYSGIEKLSMQFFATAADSPDFNRSQLVSAKTDSKTEKTTSLALLYILENPYNNTISFANTEPLTFDVTHEFIPINSDKTMTFRIYVVENNPVQIAKQYRAYLIEKGAFKTLEQKATENPAVRKIYGAPHIYLYNSFALDESNIDFEQFRKQLKNPVVMYVKKRIDSETKSVFAALEKKTVIDRYQKTVICRTISEQLFLPDFYDSSIFPETDETMQKLLAKGQSNLNEAEWFTLNKHALAVNLADVFTAPETWAQSRSTAVISDMKNEQLENVWIGLDNWQEAFIAPSLVKQAVSYGWLIGSYDSYHSIHEPGKEKWNTAAFPGTDLYESATVANRDNQKYTGFNKVGRKLNPVLAFDAVEKRVNSLITADFPFNSWFVDCDATGEVFDDYSPAHQTTEAQDIAARLERMAWISREKNAVVGSEGGNDYASTTIVFAHGLALPSFSWMDADMKNPSSEYYIGKYFSATGGVPDHFGTTVPIKSYFKELFFSQNNRIPLYRLVYNDSVILSYHWDWHTLKISGEEVNRMLHEISFNIPPLYQLDSEYWKANKNVIVPHAKQFARFAKKTLAAPMTDFYLPAENIVLTQYGANLRVVVNYRETDFVFEDHTIPPKSLIIIENDVVTPYTPYFKK